MRYRIPLLVFLFLISAQLIAAQAQAPAETPEKPLYNATGSEAMVTGTIIVTDTIPIRRRIDTAADPVCGQLNPNPQTDDILVNQGKLENAFVYLTGESLNAYRFAVPESDVVLVQRNCQFAPHVLGLRVGQTLQVINNDPTTHNVHPTPKFNPEGNQS